MIVVVTGLMRSATSEVARILHDEGIWMGTAMLFPLPGVQPEYEDADLALPLATAMLRESPVTADGFRDYIRMREKRHGARWGVKLPHLCAVWPIWEEAVGDREMRVVVTHRDVLECRSSLERAFSASPQGLKLALRLQRQIRKGYKRVHERADCVVYMKELRETPSRVRERLRATVEG